MSFSQETVDPLDLDDYLDFSQSHGSPVSSASHATAKAIRSPEQTTPRARQSLMKQPSGPGMFAAPSHQYDMHKQQTGLPVGGLASTIAANRQAGYAVSGFAGSNFGLQDSSDMFDFNALPANPSSFGGMPDMDMDFGSPVDGMMHGNEFIDPHAVGGRETQSPPPREAVRVYPGMHSQQAAMAKQQQQQEIQRQQQLKASQQQQPQQGHSRQPSRPANNAPKPSDPLVEERISRLLNQMRQGSVASNGDSQQAQSQQRPAKREEDMDEDEKLLASEEGKKLTSKERRQLRNKVSARAFRSRRKEYIGQLEGELTAKQQENEELHAENEALRSENMRLTDLSKMLLSSPAFSNFLNELSANGVPGLPQALANQQQRSLAAQMAKQQQQPPKDPNPHQSQLLLQQQQQQQQMPAVSEEMDFSNLDANGSWGVGMDFGFDQQVFAVTELPEAPLTEAIDTSVLSGKSSFVSGPESDSKLDMPVIEAAPAVTEPAKPTAPVINEAVTFDASNPAYALFSEAPAPAKTETTEVDQPVFGVVPFGKAVERFEITVDSDGELHAAAMAHFEALSSRLHELAERVDGWTPSE